MHSILVPIDGSEQARRALQYAIKSIKEGMQKEIHVLNVQPIILPLGEFPLIDANLIEKAQQQQAKKLLKSACGLLDKANLKYTCHSEIGPIASTIIDYAKTYACEGIVMGCRGMGALGTLVLGSVTNQVINLTKVPVTIIK